MICPFYKTARFISTRCFLDEEIECDGAYCALWEDEITTHCSIEKAEERMGKCSPPCTGCPYVRLEYNGHCGFKNLRREI